MKKSKRWKNKPRQEAVALDLRLVAADQWNQFWIWLWRWNWPWNKN